MEGKGEGLFVKTLKDDREFPKKPAKLKQPGAFKKISKDKLLMSGRFFMFSHYHRLLLS